MGKKSKYYREKEALRKLRAEESFGHCWVCNHCNKEYGHCEKNKLESFPSAFCSVVCPSITVNVFSENTKEQSIDLETFQYITQAEKGKMNYTNQDALYKYGSSEIPDPDGISSMTLFVNGVLQPEVLYEVKQGSLLLNTAELPPIDAPIILLFVVVK